MKERGMLFSALMVKAVLVALDALQKQQVRFELEQFQVGVDTMNDAIESLLACYPELNQPPQ